MSILDLDRLCCFRRMLVVAVVEYRRIFNVRCGSTQPIAPTSAAPRQLLATAGHGPTVVGQKEALPEVQF